MIYLGFWHIEGEEGENVINIYLEEEAESLRLLCY